MSDWLPYERYRQQPPDFRIAYRLYTEAEGGRRHPVVQGYRCDFAYDGDDIKKTGIYCIHPEFEDEAGNVILDRSTPVPQQGTATMWIVFPEMRRLVHVNRIETGVTGCFMEGSRRVGQVTVIEVLGLHQNAERLST